MNNSNVFSHKKCRYDIWWGCTLVCSVLGTLAGGFVLDKMTSTISNALRYKFCIKSAYSYWLYILTSVHEWILRKFLEKLIAGAPLIMNCNLKDDFLVRGATKICGLASQIVPIKILRSINFPHTFSSTYLIINRTCKV